MLTGSVAARGRQFWRVAAPVAMLGVVAVLLSGCSLVPSNPQTTLDPHSDVAQKIQDLFAFTVWLAVAIGVIIEIGLMLAIFRFRRRPGQAVGAPEGRHGSTRIEIIWTILPALVLVVLAVLTVPLIFSTAEAAPKNAVQIDVTGHQWWWEYDYKQYGFKTANELHLPVGRPVTFNMKSDDVIHSFWIPGLDGKRDVLPNHYNNLWFTPQKVGVYPGQCGEFCGPSHSFMYLKAFVDTPAQFDAWAKSHQHPAGVAANASAQIRHGAVVFAQGACAGCHTISGTVAQGNIGPNLTNLGSRTYLSAQLLPNTPQNLAAWIRNSSDFKPGSHMPPQNLSKQDLADVVAYLESLK